MNDSTCWAVSVDQVTDLALAGPVILALLAWLSARFDRYSMLSLVRSRHVYHWAVVAGWVSLAAAAASWPGCGTGWWLVGFGASVVFAFGMVAALAGGDWLARRRPRVRDWEVGFAHPAKGRLAVSPRAWMCLAVWAGAVLMAVFVVRVGSWLAGAAAVVAALAGTGLAVRVALSEVVWLRPDGLVWFPKGAAFPWDRRVFPLPRSRVAGGRGGVRPSGQTGGRGREVALPIRRGLVERGHDDPIVADGQPGQSAWGGPLGGGDPGGSSALGRRWRDTEFGLAASPDSSVRRECRGGLG